MLGSWACRHVFREFVASDLLFLLEEKDLYRICWSAAVAAIVDPSSPAAPICPALKGDFKRPLSALRLPKMALPSVIASLIVAVSGRGH